MSVRERFHRDVEAFLARHDMAPTRFGTDAVKDPGFVFDLRKGERSFSLQLVERVYAYMGEMDAQAEAA